MNSDIHSAGGPLDYPDRTYLVGPDILPLVQKEDANAGCPN